ncbi:glycoside hydrolase family 65 protein [Lactococcus cremoris]|uniref:Putative trehalose/maltose hydrolase n=1 Tax=Lactococcus lactis subsp. cremoris (strain MG1363) TaxID=416870 RepID=A2RIG4_LACLM|nr:glycoside hydrolase family 65 protein [Lactococcus cremoris]ADJ59469.1 putative trehalose/maltose hydrolase [Lactococcus cremoris subsp. cremoris NZ9000]KZK51882.1 Trehalose 6-phosphate phosphorylase [Lactococcus cremoris]MCT4434343.1 glycoside hydrolase family 65 protein [Lactococcus cremoris]MCT4445409.1 glycoside hydrolase family 65 protein [Lactococcus cremoris]MCZ7687803.1 glycoside hydrolase family 65 protein [Lactococcus cremoris]
MTDKDWMIQYDKQEVGKRSYGQESLMSLGNGYLGLRGAPLWATCSDNHYPGLYVAGVFNHTSTEVAGHDVINEDMVNWPNPQLIKVYIDNELVDFEAAIEKNSSIDFKNGLQIESYNVSLAKGGLTLVTTKFVDPIHFHDFGFVGEIIADFSGKLRIETFIDGSVLNQNVERYRAFDSKEFEVTQIADGLLVAKTRTTDIELAVATKTYLNGQPLKKVESGNSEIFKESIEVDLLKNQEVQFEKSIVIASSYETKNPVEFVLTELAATSVSKIQENNANYWEKVWQDGDIVIESDHADLQRMVRMNIFHIRQAAQHGANQFLDASVGSRGLTGEGYRGHIFWDEIFVLPYYAANEPETARDLLLYRINRLTAAQENAKVDGEIGAMFPWQSGLIGDEQAQFVHLNTVNNEWEPDNSRRQRHVSLAIVYNLWIYLQLTDDESILTDGGLDLLVETTKFWLNKAELGSDSRYHIAGVMGPDEYHEAYPGQEGGICDNAYTNLMLTWQLNWLTELSVKGFEIPADLLEESQKVRENLYLDIDENGVIAQYAKYFELKEVDFAAYEAKYGDIHRIDRLMKAEGISPDEYQVAKQADTLMLMYNLGHEHVIKLVKQLGYELPKNWLKVNRDYYLARTVHGSTTSRPVFAGIDVKLGDFDEALDFLITAIGSDYYDIQGGTTAEGVHIGVMGETLEVIQNEFAGLTLRDGYFSIAPHLPKSWTKLKFSQIFKGCQVEILIEKGQLLLTASSDLLIKVYDEEVQLKAGVQANFDLK